MCCARAGEAIIKKMAIDTTAKRVFIYPSPGNGNYVQKKTAVYNSSEYTFGSPAFYGNKFFTARY
jgi:hypothetical protein